MLIFCMFASRDSIFTGIDALTLGPSGYTFPNALGNRARSMQSFGLHGQASSKCHCFGRWKLVTGLRVTFVEGDHSRICPICSLDSNPELMMTSAYIMPHIHVLGML